MPKASSIISRLQLFTRWKILFFSIFLLLSLFIFISLKSYFISILLHLSDRFYSTSQQGELSSYSPKHKGIDFSRFLPIESTKIRYISQNSGWSHSLDWSCVVKRHDFINFANKKKWHLKDQKPGNRNVLFQFYGKWEMPEDYYYYFAPTASSAGLEIMYDKTHETYYGHYSNR